MFGWTLHLLQCSTNQGWRKLVKVGKSVPSIKDRDTILNLRGPWANWVTSKARHNLEGGLGVLPWKILRPLPSNLLKTTLIFVPQLTLLVNLRWDVHIPDKSKQPNLPKATVELIASWCGTSFLACKYPRKSFLDY